MSVDELIVIREIVNKLAIFFIVCIFFIPLFFCVMTPEKVKEALKNKIVRILNG